MYIIRATRLSRLDQKKIRESTEMMMMMMMTMKKNNFEFTATV
jgi:hypothetical protein